MIFKIVYNNEIHRIRTKISTFQELIATIAARLPSLVKTNLCCDYSDLDGDRVRINCQEDFAILLDELEGQKSVKIFVKEDLNQTLQLPTAVSESEIVVEEKAEEKEPESPKVESPKSPVVRKEPVLMTFVGKYEPEKPAEDEISIDKAPKEEAKPEEREEREEEYTGRCPYMKKHWGEKRGGWGGRGGCHGGRGGHWRKKRQWWREKFNRKFDDAIQRALPQIAVHVAQILGNDGKAPMPNKACSPMKTADIHANQSKVVHHGYICDGCGVSPIVGVCYKSSVTPDFDFCEKCEATIPHPHPFLKLRTPEQRPHALIVAVNEEGAKPFKMGKHMPQLKKHMKEMLGKMTDCNDYDEKEVDALFKKFSNFVNPEQLKAFGISPEIIKKMMKTGGNKCGQKHFMKMINQGKKFFHKFMKEMNKDCSKKAKKEAKKAKKEAKKAKKPTAMPFSYDQFANKCQSQGKNPFSTMCEMWKNAKKSCKQAKKDVKKPVEAMTYDEQIAHAMKLSQASQSGQQTPAEKKTAPKPASKCPQTNPMAGFPFNPMGMMNMFANAQQNKNQNPFAAMCEMWQNAKKSCKQAKKDVKKPVEAMTFDEQIAHAMKLSAESAKKAAKAEKKEDFDSAMTPNDVNVEVKKPEDSVKETNASSSEKDSVVIMNEDDSENTEDLYDDDKTKTNEPLLTQVKKEELKIPEKKVEKKVVKVEEVDPVVLSNASQLMMVFGIPEKRRDDIQKWVAVNLKIGNLGINELLNKFIDEGMNKVF